MSAKITFCHSSNIVGFDGDNLVQIIPVIANLIISYYRKKNEFQKHFG